MDSTEKRINVDVNKDIWKKVGSYASEHEKSKKEVVNLALLEFLEKVKK